MVVVVVAAGEGPVLVVGVQCVEEPAQLSSAQPCGGPVLVCPPEQLAARR